MHPDFPVSETELVFPNPSVIENFEFTFEAGIDIDGDEISRLSFDVLDEAGVENFYEIRMNIDGAIVSLSTVDLSGAEGFDSRNVIFSDETFDGERRRLSVSFSRFFWNPAFSDDIIIAWSSVNEGYFELNKTLRLQLDTDDNPFTSAVQLNSNVNNALGVIGFKNIRLDTIRP